MTKTLSIKISSAEKEQLQRIAELRSVSMSHLLREGLQNVLDGVGETGADATKRKVMRMLEEHWANAPAGPEDLSTNKRHMEGFGRS